MSINDINDINYISENEKEILKQSIKTQIQELEAQLKDKKQKKESKINIMKEVNDNSGDE